MLASSADHIMPLPVRRGKLRDSLAQIQSSQYKLVLSLVPVTPWTLSEPAHSSQHSLHMRMLPAGLRSSHFVLDARQRFSDVADMLT